VRGASIAAAINAAHVGVRPRIGGVVQRTGRGVQRCLR
jgi:hypothetical protein